MVVDGRREALDVVVQDEDVEEVTALVEEDRDVPRGGHDRGTRPIAAGRQELAEPAPLARGDEVPGEDQGRQQEAERALGERRQARGRGRGHDREALRHAEHAKADEADRHRHRGGEQHVHRGGAAVDEGQERRAGHEPGVQAGGRPVEARSEEGRRPHEEKRRQHRGDPGRRLRLAEDREGAPGQPVEERRLLEPGLALERRRHPLARPVHLDRDARVAGLVRAEEGDRPQAKDQEGEDEGQEDRRRARREAQRHRSESYVR